MLTALATFYPGYMSKAQVARAAKMSSNSGTFKTYWSEFKQRQLLEDGAPEMFRASDEGLSALGAGRPTPPKDLAERLVFWKQRFRDGERRMLDAVVAAGSRGITREELGVAARLSPDSGTFKTYRSNLRKNKLVAVAPNGRITPHDWLILGPSHS